jgi:hypothetical protein
MKNYHNKSYETITVWENKESSSPTCSYTFCFHLTCGQLWSTDTKFKILEIIRKF